MADYYFGEIPGNPVGTAYESREAAKRAGVHQVGVQGIAGNRHVGCVSIVLNGGYDTDEDFGHEVFYTGAGGQDPQSRKRHIADQDLGISDNAALVESERTGKPIRIIRGWKGDEEFSPSAGYRYDGLYRVAKHYEHFPRDGFRRWIFHLVQLTADDAYSHTPAENRVANVKAFARAGLGSAPAVNDLPDPAKDVSQVDPFYGTALVFELPAGKSEPGIQIVVTQRVIRDTKVTLAVKAMYDNGCQICGIRVATGNGHYSEGAHIRPLGGPHHGPDTMDNILCLCPNHHAAFDKGGLYLGDKLEVVSADGEHMGTLQMHDGHALNLNNVRYHRTHHGFGFAAVNG